MPTQGTLYQKINGELKELDFALNSAVVHTTGNETVSGIKTFSAGSGGITLTGQNDAITIVGKDETYKIAFLRGTTYCGIYDSKNGAWILNQKVSGSTYTNYFYGRATSATKLTTARNFRAHLDSSEVVAFDGTNHCALGVTGVLPIANGGTGRDGFSNNNGVIYIDNSTTPSTFKAIATKSGALYATSANGVSQFGTLPVAQGGTGQTSIANIQAGKDGSGNTITDTYATKTELANISSISGNADTATKAFGIPLVIPNETASSATLTATVDGITEYFAGLTIALRMPFASVASTTLNINELGAKPVYYQNTTTTAGYFPVGSVILLVYETASNATGCFKAVYSYNANTNNATAQNKSTTNNTYPVLFGATANATANIGNKATYFCTDVKINPSTGELSANTLTAANFSGGKVTGALTVSTPGSSTPGWIYAPLDGDEGYVYGFSVNYGGSVRVFSKEDVADRAGSFHVIAADGTNTRELIGKPDGTLKWCGNDFAMDNAVVHKTGSETIGGTKNFSDTIESSVPAVALRTTIPSGNTWRDIGNVIDANNVRVGYVRGWSESGADRRMSICCVSEDGQSFSALDVRFTSDGYPVAVTGTPPAASNSTHIATTAWVRSRLSDTVVAKATATPNIFLRAYSAKTNLTLPSGGTWSALWFSTGDGRDSVARYAGMAGGSTVAAGSYTGDAYWLYWRTA